MAKAERIHASQVFNTEEIRARGHAAVVEVLLEADSYTKKG